MREICVTELEKMVYSLCLKANRILPPDVMVALQDATKREADERGKTILSLLVENAQQAEDEEIAICQDTGQVVVFLDIGQEVHFVGGSITDAVNAGIRLAYADGYFRNSIVSDPLIRMNSGDNTPGVIIYEMIPGDSVKITIMPKGFGSENMSGIKMLKPAEGIEGIKQFVLDQIRKAGGNPCPPIIVGIGIGGTMDKAAVMAKRALLREIGSMHPDHHIAVLEQELLDEINQTGIGPGGLGGQTTALSVQIETYPTHIAGLPVAINIGCHAARHACGSI